jgi:hypothetical protein
MTAPSLLKKTLKFIILILFLYDKFILYKEIKAKEYTFNLDLHHTLFMGFDVNLSNLNDSFKSHQIFKIPYAQSMVEKVMNKITHLFNINETYSHEGHSHPKHDFTHNFKNRLIDLESKFKFYFLTAYDLLMMTFLYYLFSKDSLVGNIILLFNVGLKLTSIILTHGTKNHLKFFDYIIYTFSKHSKGFEKIWHEVKEFFNKEKILLTNVALFSLLFILLLYIISVKMSERLDLNKVAKEASIVRQVIENKLHQMGVGSFPEAENIPMNKSPEKASKKEEKSLSSPDYPSMKTEESEANLKDFKSNKKGNGIQKEMEETIRSREIEQHQNPNKSKSRSRTPSKRRIQQPTL